VVTDCFDQVGMAHRFGIALGHVDEDVHSFRDKAWAGESCVEDAMAVPAASSKHLS
jgi:hypothetical protein